MVDSLGQVPENSWEQKIARIRAPFTFLLTSIFMIFCTTLFTICSFLRIKELDDWIIYSWASISCRINGIRIRVEGKENLPKRGGLLLFNHSSLCDIPVMYTAITKSYRFGAKAELFKVPFLGMTLKSMGALPIHRGRREDVLKLYEKSVPRIDAGESFALAPEGTRQDKAEIGRFKSGPFIFAVKARCPISLVVLKGVNEVLPKKSLFANQDRLAREVTVKILPQVNAADYSVEQIDELKDYCREKMLAAFT